MILQYGGFPFQNAEVTPTFFGQWRIYNQRGRAQLLRKRMTIEGEIIADGQAAINARMGQIQSAFALEGGTCVLLTDAGAETNYRLDSSAVSGVRIIEGPSFHIQDGKAHFATGLPFSITLEADYLVNDGDSLVSWSERVTRIGNGGPRVATIELDNGLPIRQIVSASTPVQIIQSGEAVGATTWPNFPGAIFPAYLDNPEEAEGSDAPRTNGLGFLDFPIHWQYRHTLPYNPGTIRPNVY